MSDFGIFVEALVGDVIALLSSIASVILGVIGALRATPEPPKYFWIAALVCVVYACYRVWQKEHRALEAANGRIKSLEIAADSKTRDATELAEWSTKCDRAITLLVAYAGRYITTKPGQIQVYGLLGFDGPQRIRVEQYLIEITTARVLGKQVQPDQLKMKVIQQTITKVLEGFDRLPPEVKQQIKLNWQTEGL
jgi:hypothetical protein